MCITGSGPSAHGAAQGIAAGCDIIPSSACVARTHHERLAQANMIQGYSDHAANERTYLAWIRTGIAVIAFGFVVEKFNIFMATIALAASSEIGRQLPLHPARSFGRWDGLVLILGGVTLLIVATVRFVRTTALLDDPATHSVKSVRLEVMVSTILIVVVASYSVYLAIGGGGSGG